MQLVNRPDKDPFAAVAHQLAEGDRDARICPEKSGVLGHAPRFAKIGQEGLLVGALLRTAVELG